MEEHHNVGPTEITDEEQRLIDLLLESAETLGANQEVDDSTWEGMVKRQNLAERSLESNVQMSGPL